MKVWKKNVTAAAVLVVVCAGIYLNWMYTEGDTPASLTDTLDAWVEKARRSAQDAAGRVTRFFR